MIRHISALAALVALSFSSIACLAPTENETEVEETSQDLVSRSAHFETFEGLDGLHDFHLVAGNGQDVLQSQGYEARRDADDGISSVLANGTSARSFEILEARSGAFYFNLKANNKAVLGTSQLYAKKSNAERGVRTVQALVLLAAQDSRTFAAPREERFELFTGEDNSSYFRLRASNGEILLTSEGYAAKTSAKQGIELVKATGASAEGFDIFEARDGRWAVNLVARNGETIARGELYSSKSNATRAVRRMVEILSRTVSTTEATSR